MPSGEIRRGTRVIGMVKGADGVRVLRSGRRLFPERQVKRAKDEHEWLHHCSKKYHPKCKDNGATNDAKLKRKASEIVVHPDTEEAPRSVKRARLAVKKVKKSVASSDKIVKTRVGMGESVDKMFGIGYRRKRKRASLEKHESSGNRKEEMDDLEGSVDVRICAFAIVVQSSGTGAASLLTSILSFIKNVDVGISQLAGFLLSVPLYSAFASSGIRFLQDAPAARKGVCKLFKSMSSVPLFDLDFSVIPSWFMSMHLTLLISMSHVPVAASNSEECDEMMSEDEEEIDQLCVSGKMPVLMPSVGSSRLTLKSTQSRNSHHSRGVQKRRSSRRRIARNPSLLGVDKANGFLEAKSVGSQKNNFHPSFVFKCNLRNASQARGRQGKPKEADSAVVGETNCQDQSRCFADILVIESDRGYRLKGTTIVIESADSKVSLLVAKKDGATKLSFLPEKYMRPISVNRVTHNLLWSRCQNWKLEFTSRQDWSIFKELYKQCVNLNTPSPLPKPIPVPGVREVAEYGSDCLGFFSRPDAYISIITDEASRALAKQTANYDMDSDDEKWLEKFNLKSAAADPPQLLSKDQFELMIDEFEKALYRSTDGVVDIKAAVSVGVELEAKEVTEAVYSYWMGKRKQRQSALLRIFQIFKLKKAPVIGKLVLRKRRSFKRQGCQNGKGKQPGLVQAMAVEQDVLEVRNAKVRMEEADKAAKQSMELAIVIRRNAQLLMENASLLCYKASMVVRIAEGSCAFDPKNIAQGSCAFDSTNIAGSEMLSAVMIPSKEERESPPAGKESSY